MLDVLIIGQGVAGSILAYELIKKKLDVAIITDPDKSSASLVAAGLIQTISGRHLSIAENTIEQINQALIYYKTLEKEFNKNFISPIKCYRFLDDAQLKKWNQKKQKVPYQTYLSNKLVQVPNTLNNKLNFIEVFNNFHINPSILLNEFKSYFEKKNCIFYDGFTEKDLLLFSDYIQYKAFKSKKIIFCTGHYISDLTFANHISFQHVKGETQTVKIKEDPFNCVYQGSEWIVPFMDDTYKIGATYDHQLTLNITTKGQSKLSHFITELGLRTKDIVSQQAGIRCVTKERVPLIGAHPTHKNLLFFSGFGSKGFMTCPYFKDQLIKRYL
ncbi:MAG: hypothetical protein CMP39_05990 [Rickettsiales bacterium]|nr:hypothetical protein [Rickettsiales bacterium]|tara:strand:- start:26 stop:1012 length:987 start_codon:yes stop_codon:yes gene_type:complete